MNVNEIRECLDPLGKRDDTSADVTNGEVWWLLGELDAQAAELKTAQTCPRCKGSTLDPDSRPSYYNGVAEPGSFDPCALCDGGSRVLSLDALYEDLELMRNELTAVRAVLAGGKRT